MDYLASLFDQFAPSARAFFSGTLCNVAAFDDPDGAGYLHILRAGQLQVDQAGQTSFHLSEPSLLFSPRRAPHSFIPNPATGADLICAKVQIGGSQANPIAQSLPEMLVIPMARIETIGPTLDLLLSEAFGERDARQIALDRLFEYLMVQLMRHVIDDGLVDGGVLAGLGDARLARALTAMHDAPGRPWALDDLAEISGMSRTRFAAHFRQVVGSTPIDYLARWRMMIAQDLLRKGRPIKAVAAAVGYESPAALSRTFSKIVGRSPRQWSAENGV